MREAYAEHGIDPNTWEVHYAPQRYGAIPGDSLVRTCGSPSRRHAGRYVSSSAISLCRASSSTSWAPEERLVRAVGRPLQVG